jgi:plasmid stability protein
MAAITIRNLSDETHQALRVRAAEHGRSTEAEIRAILDEGARPATAPFQSAGLTVINPWQPGV